MVSDLPKYMSDVLHFSIKDNGIYSSLPYLLMWAVSVSTGFLSDFLITRSIISITGARKIFTAVGKFVDTRSETNRNKKFQFFFKFFSSAAVLPAFFIVAASYAGCDKIVVVIWFTLAMGFMGTFYPGMKVNPLDLSPNYAGSLMAVTNGIGALTGVAAPYLVGVMTPHVSFNKF